MTSEHVAAPPPVIPSVSTGTPPTEWSEGVLASGTKESDSAVPVRPQTLPGSLDVDIMSEPDPDPEVKAPTEPETQPANSEASQGSREPATRHVSGHGVKEAASVHDKEHLVSMPSEEVKGAQPREHIGGVGSLPGNLSESSVALLPDERQESGRPVTPPQTGGRERRDTIRATPAETGVAESKQTQPREWEKAELSKQDSVPSLPSDISAKATAESTEAEACPVETSQAKKEKKTGDAGQAVSASEAAGGEEAAGAGAGSVGKTSDAGETGEKKQDTEPSATSEKADQGKGPTRDQREEENKQVRTPPKPGYGGDYHPAELHPPPPGASVAEYRASMADQKEEEHEAPPSPTQAKRASGSGKKPGFMSMVKGEMKVLAGKMSGDEEKVAEGKKLMHREA